MNRSKETEEVNKEGEIETKVETVDYRSPPGQDKEPTKEIVEVIHLNSDKDQPIVGVGAFAGSAAAVANTDRAAKDEIETKVETVDYRSPPGQDKEPTKKKVEVIHLNRDKDQPSVGVGAFAGSAAAVANTVRTAKDAVLGGGKDDTKNESSNKKER